jgi:uncharacterized membrane protein YdbT with pleckstrin-like domain
MICWLVILFWRSIVDWKGTWYFLYKDALKHGTGCLAKEKEQFNIARVQKTEVIEQEKETW